MRVVIPYTDRDPKSRLSPVLSGAERREFARAMLGDVVEAVRNAGHDPELLVPEPIDSPGSGARLDSVPTTVDDRALTPAVDAVLGRLSEGVAEMAIVMADLPLATATALRRLCAVGGDVAVAPGRGGGTNALVVRAPSFSVDYHGASYRDHRDAAAVAGLSVGVVDSMRLATDVDEPADFAEVLLHGDGRGRRWLVDAGFELDATDGRVGIRRE